MKIIIIGAVLFVVALTAIALIIVGNKDIEPVINNTVPPAINATTTEQVPQTPNKVWASWLAFDKCTETTKEKVGNFSYRFSQGLSEGGFDFKNASSTIKAGEKVYTCRKGLFVY